MMLFLLLAAAAPVLGQPVVNPNPFIGKWEQHLETDKLTGKQSYFANLISDDTVQSILDLQQPAILQASCDGQKARVFVTWPDLIQEIGGPSLVIAGWKIDAGKINTSVFELNDSVTAAIRGGGALKFMDAVAFGQALVLQLRDHHGGQAVTFSVSGANTIVGRMRGMGCR